MQERRATLSTHIARLLLAAVASAAVLIGGSSFLIVRHQLLQSQEAVAELENSDISGRLEGSFGRIVGTLHGLAANNAVANALVDSTGRESYLRPLMNGFDRLTGISGELALTDYRGRVVARTEHADDRWFADMGWSREVVVQNRAMARLESIGGQRLLFLAEPVIYPNTGTGEGAIILAMSLNQLETVLDSDHEHGVHHLLTLSMGPQEWRLGDPPPLSGFQENLLRLPPPLDGLRMELRTWGDPELRIKPLRQITLLITLVSTAVAIAVVLAGRRFARRVAAPLHRLAAEAAAMEPGADARFSPGVTGTVEIEDLTATIGAMVARLNFAYLEMDRTARQRIGNAETIAKVGSWRWWPDSGIMRWSDQFRTLLGLPMDLPPSWGAFSACLKPEDAQALDRAMEALRTQDREFSLECTVSHSRHLRILGSWGIVGLERHCDGTVQDITDMVEARRRVQEAHRRLEAILDNAPVGITIISMERRVQQVNAKFCEIFGLEREQIVGHTTLAIYPSEEEYADLGRRAYDLLKGGDQFRDEISMRRGDGTTFLCQLIGRMVDAADPSQGAIWVTEDVTQRRAAERELARANAMLAEQAKELARSNAELEQFAYVASHDLRQPLRMVSSYLTLLQRRLGPDLDADCTTFVNFAVDGAKRMDALILGLLEYSRVGRNQAPALAASLAEAVSEALTNLQFAITDAQAELVVAPDLPAIGGVPVELVRLFQNLIGNAIKYQSPGTRPRVEISWSRTQGGIQVSVADNGIGIAQQDCERVFGIFQRLVTPQEYEGTGIGLAVCRKIVEHHGGRIWVESEPGKGSVFHVWFPGGAEG